MHCCMSSNWVSTAYTDEESTEKLIEKFKEWTESMKTQGINTKRKNKWLWNWISKMAMLCMLEDLGCERRGLKR